MTEPDFRQFLPPLPPFSSDWPPQVQAAWFQCYLRLVKISPPKEDQIVQANQGNRPGLSPT